MLMIELCERDITMTFGFMFCSERNWNDDLMFLGFYPHDIFMTLPFWLPHIWHQQLHLKTYKNIHSVISPYIFPSLGCLKFKHTYFEASMSISSTFLSWYKRSESWKSHVSDRANKERKINEKRKSMSQVFLLCGQPQEENRHDQVKIWPFESVLSPTSAYFFIISSSLSPLHTWYSVSYGVSP